MEKKYYKATDETLTRTVLANGLTVLVVPKPNFKKTFAFFATRYGGMDMSFSAEGKLYKTPAGVAHFLEHKTFDTEDGNALQDLSERGASPNAFTSSDITGYYFDCTDNFEENLNILLSFVSVPYYTEESVAKEQGIIGQEIGMGDDDPATQLYYTMLEAMYRQHPIRVNIAGTVESISQINAQTLYLCHKHFYNPSNMVLCVEGNADPRTVIAAADKIFSDVTPITVQREYGEIESCDTARDIAEKHMDVAAPLFQIGWKLTPPAGGEETLRWELLYALTMDALCGLSSPLYTELYADGLINDSFSFFSEHYEGAAFAAVSGESRNPEKVRERISREIGRLRHEGLDKAFFERIKKAQYGDLVQGFNSFENTCINMAMAQFHGFDWFSAPEVLQSITEEDVRKCLDALDTDHGSAMAVILPKEV